MDVFAFDKGDASVGRFVDDHRTFTIRKRKRFAGGAFEAKKAEARHLPTTDAKNIARSVVKRAGVNNVDVGSTEVVENVIAIAVLCLQAIGKEAH